VIFPPVTRDCITGSVTCLSAGGMGMGSPRGHKDNVTEDNSIEMANNVEVFAIS